MCFNSLISYVIVFCSVLFLFYSAAWRHLVPEFEYKMNEAKRLLAESEPSFSLNHRHILPVDLKDFKEIMPGTCENLLKKRGSPKLQRSVIWNMATIVNTLLTETPVAYADQLDLQSFFEYAARKNLNPSSLDARTSELLAKHFAKDHHPEALAYLASHSPHFDRIRPLITRLIPADAAQFLSILPCFSPASLVELFDPIIHDNNALLGALIYSAVPYRLTAPILIAYLNQPGISRAELMYTWQSVQSNLYTIGVVGGAIKTTASSRLFDNINRNLLCLLEALGHESGESEEILDQFMNSIYEDMLKRLFRMTLDGKDLESVWNLTVMASRALAINADRDDFKKWSSLIENTLQAERFEPLRTDQEKYNGTYTGVMELFQIRREHDDNGTEVDVNWLSCNVIQWLFSKLCLIFLRIIR
jgi:hypothetical protein